MVDSTSSFASSFDPYIKASFWNLIRIYQIFAWHELGFTNSTESAIFNIILFKEENMQTVKLGTLPHDVSQGLYDFETEFKINISRLAFMKAFTHLSGLFSEQGSNLSAVKPIVKWDPIIPSMERLSFLETHPIVESDVNDEDLWDIRIVTEGQVIIGKNFEVASEEIPHTDVLLALSYFEKISDEDEDEDEEETPTFFVWMPGYDKKIYGQTSEGKSKKKKKQASFSF